MAGQQPKWAWWIVGIVVPIVIAAIPYILLKQARAPETSPNTPNAESAASLESRGIQSAAAPPIERTPGDYSDGDEERSEDEPKNVLENSPETRTRENSANRSTLSNLRPAAPSEDAIRTSNKPEKSQVPSSPTRSMNNLLTPYTLKHGDVISSSDPDVSLSINFERILSQDVMTFIAVAAGGETLRSPIMSAGTAVDLPDPYSSWTVTILAINWDLREATVKLSKRAARHDK